MKWEGRRQSENVEDRRGTRPSGGLVAGGGLGLLLLIAFALFTGNEELLEELVVEPPGAQAPAEAAPGNDVVRQFVATVLADTEEVWGDMFAASGSNYPAPRLVLFTGATPMPGGVAQTAMGPFYLPANQTIYLDFDFFEQMQRQFGMHGDFAAGYVIAHEVGHHVQHLMGLTDKVHQQAGRIPQDEYNRLSVRLELQADFLAGVWAHHAQKRWQILEEGDLEEALSAASIVGDDRLQRATQGRVVPDSFTHGTSEQRVRWFTRGLQTGDLSQGDTFGIPYSEL